MADSQLKKKLGSELDKTKELLIENGYPAEVLLSCINQKLANFAAEKRRDLIGKIRKLIVWETPIVT